MRAPFHAFCLALLPFIAACSGDNATPTSPSSPTPPATTRVINVTGNLAFGDVPVGSQRDLSFTIGNSGSSALTVSGMTVSGGLVTHTTASWTNGQIPAGGSQTVSVRFQPTAAGNYSGMVAVNADQTSGSNSIAISGNATGASLAGVWEGRYRVERCDGTGSNQDYFCSSRGAFPPGTTLPIRLSLTQNGQGVSGTIALGQVTGPVSGNVNAGGTLVLQGSASNGQIQLTISSWSTNASGSTMNGSFTYNAGLSGVPGVAVVVSSLSGVTKQ
jgi:Protein of unknown function (DUF1573)